MYRPAVVTHSEQRPSNGFFLLVSYTASWNLAKIAESIFLLALRGLYPGTRQLWMLSWMETCKVFETYSQQVKHQYGIVPRAVYPYLGYVDFGLIT